MICRALIAALIVATSSVTYAQVGVVSGIKSGLAIAREALRDGLWEVARLHARIDGSQEAKMLILESYALEGKWEEISKSLNSWGKVAEGDAFSYYRAMLDGDYDRALVCLKKSSASSDASEAKMLEADVRVKKGEMNKARDLWREVVSSTNSGTRAFVIAAANLGEVEYLRQAQQKAPTSSLRLLVSVRLGAALLDDPTTVADGERIVRAVVKSSPDTPGAKEAYFKLGRIKTNAGEWKDALQVWAEMMEIWPDSVRSVELHQCQGEAFFKLGKLEDALASFTTAVKFSKDDASSLASALLRQGDVLSELGRRDEAMKCYRKVLSDCPNTDVAEKLRRVVEIMELEEKGRVHFREYRFAEAQKAFASVAKADPRRKSRMDYFDILCLYGLGRDDAALEKARALSANCPVERVKADAMLWLAKFMFNRGEWKEASALFISYSSSTGACSSVADALGWAAKAAFADGDYAQAIKITTQIVEKYHSSPAVPGALIVQGESLIELARYAEALLVLERVANDEKASQADRVHARLLLADSLFALGADNPQRYSAALNAYKELRFGGLLDPSGMITVSFRIGRALEKLKRYDEAVDEYYSHVVLAYCGGRANGEVFDDSAKAAFSRAAFRLADDFESRGREFQAMNVLRLVSTSDVPAAEEATRRLERISKKGRFL